MSCSLYLQKAMRRNCLQYRNRPTLGKIAIAWLVHRSSHWLQNNFNSTCFSVRNASFMSGSIRLRYDHPASSSTLGTCKRWLCIYGILLAKDGKQPSWEICVWGRWNHDQSKDSKLDFPSPYRWNTWRDTHASSLFPSWLYTYVTHICILLIYR